MQIGRLPIVVALFLIPLSLRAQNNNWLGNSTVWRSTANWSTGNIPTLASKVIISTSSFAPYVPPVSGSDTAKTGVLTVQSGANLYFDPNPNYGVLVVYGTEKLLNDGNITLGDGKIIFKNNITFQNGGTFDAGSGSLDFQGVTWVNNSGSTFLPGASTVTFNGSTSASVTGNISFYNVQFDNTSGSVSLSGNVTILNSMVVDSGCTVTLSSTGSLTLASTATLDLQGGSTLVLNGAFNNNGTITGSGSISSNKPYINSVTGTSSMSLDVTFSKAVDASSSQTSSNYSINKGISVINAARDASNHAIIHLDVSSLTADTVYTLTINNVIDDAGTDTIASNSKANFTYSGGPPLPVQLTFFGAIANRLAAELHWSTATEMNNYGFEIERRQMGVSSLQSANWQKVGFVAGAGTSGSPHEYSYSDANLAPGRYAYRLKQVDNNGSFTYSGAAEVEVGLAAKEFKLESNYPNPFNPSTTIEFTVAEDGKATLKVYNMIGQEVATLFDGEAGAGRLQQVKFDASRLPSGLYFAKLEEGKQQIIKKMVLLR